MAKLSDNPISVEDLREYLQGQDDFRLELATFRLFKSRGLSVLHGGTYEDPVTKLARQFDIRGAIRKKNCFVYLAVECKSLKPRFPLLVSTIPRTAEEAYHEVVYSYSNDDSRMNLPINQNFESIRINDSNLIYKIQDSCGKSTNQVGRDVNGNIITGDGEVYGKWSQAVASAFDLVSDSVTDCEKHKQDNAFSVIIPILVLNDGLLWEANYDSQGQLADDPKQVDNCEIYLGKDIWTGPMGISYTFSHIHIFTLTKLGNFLDRLTSNDHYWNALFPMNEIYNKISSQQ